LFALAIAFAACSKKTEDSKTEFGEPVGIDLGGLHVAVAAEKNHDIAPPQVLEIASAVGSVERDCKIRAFVSLTATVKDGTISAPQSASLDPAAACVAKTIDGKSAKSLAAGKILLQIVPAK
jgi:hypothetical protein